MKLLALVFCLVGVCAHAQAQACPNASTSVTIPTSGAATVMVYDQNCNSISASAQLCDSASCGSPYGPGTTPYAVTADSMGLHISTSAAAGTPHSFVVKAFGLTTPLMSVVGAPVTSISLGTSTP